MQGASWRERSQAPGVDRAEAGAARVKVVVKLVTSEGIGTIAVGVAKAGADIINVAGNTGGTGAAAVTSLKYTGRAAEIGISEVHHCLLYTSDAADE